METLEDMIDYLPDTMRDLIRVIGVQAAIVIVNKRGGVPLWVPLTPSPNHWLANTIGMEAFTALTKYAGNSRIKIPLCKEALLAIKEREILKKAQEGISQSKLAREYKMTERGIHKLLKRAEILHPDISDQHRLPL